MNSQQLEVNARGEAVLLPPTFGSRAVVVWGSFTTKAACQIHAYMATYLDLLRPTNCGCGRTGGATRFLDSLDFLDSCCRGVHGSTPRISRGSLMRWGPGRAWKWISVLLVLVVVL